MFYFYRFSALVCLWFLPGLIVAQDYPLFPNLEKALYEDANHAYDDASVIVLGKGQTSQLQSPLLPVHQGDVVDITTYVHYTRKKAKTWQKVGAMAAGIVISSLPTLLDKRSSKEENVNNGLLERAAPLVGAGVASLPFLVDRKKDKAINREVITTPTGKNGWIVPDAYLKYTFYDRDGSRVKSEIRTIDKQAKNSWQALTVHDRINQDGYVSIELGNSSKRPIWMDGLLLKIEPPLKKANSSVRQPLLSDRHVLVNPATPPLVSKRAIQQYNISSRLRDCYTKVVGPVNGYDAPPYRETICNEPLYPGHIPGPIGGFDGTQAMAEELAGKWAKDPKAAWQDFIKKLPYKKVPLNINNKLKIPCLRSAWKKAFDSKIGNLMKEFKTKFDFEVNIELLEKKMTTAWGATDGTGGSSTHINQTISFDTDMANSSLEFTVATMLHETIHAYMNAVHTYYITHHLENPPTFIKAYDNRRKEGMDRDKAWHEVMAHYFHINMSEALQNIFPNLNAVDAQALAWGGLENTKQYRHLRDSMGRKPHLFTNAHAQGKAGTPCK